jgi:hypothetical protein
VENRKDVFGCVAHWLWQVANVSNEVQILLQCIRLYDERYYDERYYSSNRQTEAAFTYFLFFLTKPKPITTRQRVILTVLTYGCVISS